MLKAAYLGAAFADTPVIQVDHSLSQLKWQITKLVLHLSDVLVC